MLSSVRISIKIIIITTIPEIHLGKHWCNYLRNKNKNKQWKNSDWHVKLCLVKQKYPSPNQKKLMYQALVQSILLYWAET
jgi:hypothetical protein